MKSAFTFIALFFIFSGLSAEERSGDVILGHWLTDDQRAKIEIYKKGEEYWGKIVWLKEPKDENGNPQLDGNNPKKELRSRTIIGLDLISSFKFEKGKWVDGKIYDPDNGKTYSCTMKLKGNKLEVRGYIGITMFGRTVVWTRTDS